MSGAKHAVAASFAVPAHATALRQEAYATIFIVNAMTMLMLTTRALKMNRMSLLLSQCQGKQEIADKVLESVSQIILGLDPMGDKFMSEPYSTIYSAIGSYFYDDLEQEPITQGEKNA
jgi:hypothetical protein